MLDGWLEFHRSELLHKCAGLTADQLVRRSVAPSTLSLLGLIRHLTEVERTWFRRRFAGDAVEAIYDSRDAAFDGAHPAEAARDYAALIEEWERCRTAVSDASLDQTYTHPEYGDMSLRWIYVHMIREYAGHCGHADLLRQAIDGRTFS
ncbi:MAG: DinB family protein [Actinomycetota bacterium]|nr:DinB family protein [Actinomycetota bacterium]